MAARAIQQARQFRHSHERATQFRYGRRGIRCQRFALAFGDFSQTIGGGLAAVAPSADFLRRVMHGQLGDAFVHGQTKHAAESVQFFFVEQQTVFLEGVQAVRRDLRPNAHLPYAEFRELAQAAHQLMHRRAQQGQTVDLGVFDDHARHSSARRLGGDVR